jgi:DNA-binding GntR family transcriptional regulator
MTTKSAARVYEELRAGIMDGRIVGGERLKESALAEEFKVSRTPVREALLQLEGEGLVSLVPNRGAIVRALGLRDIEDAFQLRALVEGFAAGKAAGNLSDQQIADLERCCNQMEHHSRENPDESAIFEIMALNDTFHQAILAGSGNRKLTGTLRSTLQLPRAYRIFIWRNPNLRYRSNTYHRELVEALRRREPLWAEATMKSHIYAALDFLIDKVAEESAAAGVSVDRGLLRTIGFS